jgi:S-adenosylmethionine synthetase
MAPVMESLSDFPLFSELRQPKEGKKRERVLVTGASGLLGRQVYAQLEQGGWTVCGLCSSRLRDKLVRCDLTKEAEIEKVFAEFKPDVVIHLAAERRPDVCHKRPEESEMLNVDVTRLIAKACKMYNAWLVFLSTDYVFDGTSPPYTVEASPKALSEYGQQKLDGEKAAAEVVNTAAILRIPLIYGPFEYCKESGVTALYPDLLNGTISKPIDHTQKRYPTYTVDVARLLVKMVEVQSSGKNLHGIFHWQANECFTKFDMVHLLADIHRLDASEVRANTSMPKIPVPMDTNLDSSRLIRELDIDPALFRTPMREALQASFDESVLAVANARASNVSPPAGGGKLLQRGDTCISLNAPLSDRLGGEVRDKIGNEIIRSSGGGYILNERDDANNDKDVINSPAPKIVRLSPPPEWENARMQMQGGLVY